MKPVYRTTISNSEEYKEFTDLVTAQILDLHNYELVIHVRITFEDEHLSSMVFHPTGAEGYHFMEATIGILAADDYGLEVTINNCVSESQEV